MKNADLNGWIQLMAALGRQKTGADSDSNS
jgi:hypothetical protein